MRARAHRAGLSPGRGTFALGAAAVAATVATVAVEVGRVWKRGSAPLPGQTRHLFAAGRTATRETLQVMREGARETPTRENALLNMLGAFVTTFGGARLVTTLIRSGHDFGLLRNVRMGDRHIHHFLPGMVVAFAAGGTAIAVRREGLDPWLAVPFGAGTALVFDEAALLLELEDVYWSEEGVLSVQLSLAAIVLLAILALAVRLMRRGEVVVLPAPGTAPAPVSPGQEQRGES